MKDIMDISSFFNPDEKPLDHLVSDGGFTGIFRTIGCIGDSLSSGEFQATNPKGEYTYHDMFDYSWGQYLARMAGITVKNFSRGGMTAYEYVSGFASANGFWEQGMDCQAFILALGVNDFTRILDNQMDFGEYGDINPDDPFRNKNTFVGNYARIIQLIRLKQPDVRFFLMTVPSGNEGNRKDLCEKHRDFLYYLADTVPHTYVLDFRKYAPAYDDNFRAKFFMDSHMNPAGYLLTAKMVASYIDYIIRHNMDKFCQTGFIGLPLANVHYEK
ncbi:MAG: SGNH/GDSL hydrolase family protein [Clostridia bacterium]|nr:SGNH/GDSL hydrolase family protein [Clostridia bacterium]